MHPALNRRTARRHRFHIRLVMCIYIKIQVFLFDPLDFETFSSQKRTPLSAAARAVFNQLECFSYLVWKAIWHGL